MLAREMHFLAVIPPSSIHNLGKLLNTAAKNKLVLGHAFTTSVDVFTDRISVQRGDTVVEIVGNVSTKGFYDNFLNEGQRLDRNITITQLPADATLVSNFLSFYFDICIHVLIGLSSYCCLVGLCRTYTINSGPSVYKHHVHYCW